MRRGTTPSVTIVVSGLMVEDLSTIKITFEQNGFQLTKNTEDITKDIENNSLTVQFTQEDTLQFGEGKVEVQVRGLLSDGQTAIASKVKQLSMEKILLDGVIKEDNQ